MGYDATGNITSRGDVAGGATWTYDPNRKHAVIEAGSPSFVYTYDANGNMTSRNGYSITWTSYNQPSLINGAGESVAFDYDENHQRWRAVLTGSAGTETTYLIGGLLEQVVDVGDTDFRHYVYAGAEKVAIVSRTTSGVNTVRYIREDHLGGVAGIENPDGTSYVTESFTAFGDRRSSCTWTGSPTAGQLSRMAAATRRGFTFHTALGSMGLNDMNGRVEDAVTGRCLSADPHITDPGNTQDYNRYSYVNNNPLTYTDPTGFSILSGTNQSGEGLGCQYGGCYPSIPLVTVTGTRWSLPGITYGAFMPADLAAMQVSGIPGGARTGSSGSSSAGWHPPLLPPSPAKPSPAPPPKTVPKKTPQSEPQKISEVVVTASKGATQPVPMILPINLYVSVLNSLLSNISASMLARLAILLGQLKNFTGEPHEGPIPPEAQTPEQQTIERPLTPPASPPEVTYDPVTGTWTIKGELPLPEDFLEIPF